ncbi:MAG: MATE family efflux transporter [Treponema sp.]|nr:MATE family efflux transporter [Treponema sp.]
MPKNPHLKGFYKTLFLIAVPMILQNLMQTFINMLDTVMVGRLGSVQIAAVGLGNQIFFLLNMVVFGISSGGSIFIAQFWGQKNINGIRRTTGAILAAALVVAAVFCAGGVFFPQTILGWYSNDVAVITEGARYLRIVSLCYPIFALSFCFEMAFRSTEHVRLPMVTTAISLVLNVFFNTLFIFGFSADVCGVAIRIPAFGVAGAAIATIIARLVSTTITIGYAYSHRFEACGSLRELFGFDRHFLARLLRIALPVVLSESLWGGGISVQSAIYAHAGTDAIAAFNIMNTVSQLTWVFFIGVGGASAIIIGKRIGAGEEDAARAYANRFAWFLPLMGAVIGLVLIPLSFLLPHIFNVEPNIISIARAMLYWLIVLYPFRAFNMLIIVGICRAGGDTIFSMAIDNGFMWLFSIPLGMVAAFVWHCPPWAIFLCLETEQILKTVAGLWRLHSGKWLRNVTK